MLIHDLIFPLVIICVVAVDIQRVIFISHLIKRVDDVIVHGGLVDSHSRLARELLAIFKPVLACFLHYGIERVFHLVECDLGLGLVANDLDRYLLEELFKLCVRVASQIRTLIFRARNELEFESLLALAKSV